MSKIFSIIALVCASLTCFSQADSLNYNSSRIQYFNNLLSGGLVGKRDAGSSLNFSTSHGVRYKRISVGIGVGYDAYRDWNLLPLFGSVSYDFASVKNNKLYLQGSWGHSWAWYTNEQEGIPRHESEGGRMIQPALGYRIQAHQWSLYLSVGYRYQTVRYTRTPWWIWGWPGNFSEHIKQDMQRLSFQIGFGFH